MAVPTDNPHGLFEALLREERIITAPRGRAVRFAFHLYNHFDDVDVALAAVRRHL